MFVFPYLVPTSWFQTAPLFVGALRGSLSGLSVFQVVRRGRKKPDHATQRAALALCGALWLPEWTVNSGSQRRKSFFVGEDHIKSIPLVPARQRDFVVSSSIASWGIGSIELDAAISARWSVRCLRNESPCTDQPARQGHDHPDVVIKRNAFLR